MVEVSASGVPSKCVGKLKFRPEKQKGSNPEGLTLLEKQEPYPFTFIWENDMIAFPGTGRPKDWAGTKMVNSRARFNCAFTSSSSRPEIMRKFSTRPVVST